MNFLIISVNSHQSWVFNFNFYPRFLRKLPVTSQKQSAAPKFVSRQLLQSIQWFFEYKRVIWGQYRKHVE